MMQDDFNDKIMDYPPFRNASGNYTQDCEDYENNSALLFNHNNDNIQDV
jgi:hypothetical protein